VKVILTQQVRRLGAPGDVVDVADGYARNFLYPRGFAVAATKGALRHAEQVRSRRVLREAKDLESAQAIVEKLASLKLRVPAKAGEAGRLFGSITVTQIATTIEGAGGGKIDRRRIHLETPIRNLGSHEVSIRIHPEIEARVTLEVVEA
jgi:large subunit ribosomal protein L9